MCCYLCPKDFSTVACYINHLRNVHLLFEPCQLRCNVGGCIRLFTTYNMLRKHINKDHTGFVVNVDRTFNISCENPVTPNSEGKSKIKIDKGCEKNIKDVASPIVDEYGISQAALKFIMALMSSSSIPLSTSEFVKNCSQNLIEDILSYLLGKTVSVLETCRCEKHVIENLTEEFNRWKTPFSGIDSQHRILSYLKNKGLYIEPVPHSMGERWDTKRDRKTKKQIQVKVKDLFYYIPIESTIKLVLLQPKAMSMLKVEQVSNFESVEDWFCGENGKKLMAYAKFKFRKSFPLFIQIYFDEVETTNPVGSKTGIHKLGAFYFVIKNFPHAANSSLNNIHMLALTHAIDIKKYSAEPVIKVIVNELQKLHDKGFDIFMDGKKTNFRCLLTQIVGDNLGLHSIPGYMENFSTVSFPCDMCMISKVDIQHVFKEDKQALRTDILYSSQVHQMQSGEISNKNCGIKRFSCLTELPYYHPASNDSADIMHDIFEGFIPCEVKLFLYHVLYDVKCMSITELNRRIKFMDYGIVCSSKPSTINESRMKSTDSLLGQHSTQMLTLFMYLPLILSDVIDKVDTQKWKLYQILKQLCDVILSPNLNCLQITYIEELVMEHHSLMKECYPEKKLLYKHHRMIHYGTIIKRSGPLLHMIVIRYEAKHNFSKRLAHIVCNFQNISFSIAKRHQIAHALAWMTHGPLKTIADVKNGEVFLVSELENKNLIIPFIGEESEVLAVDCVTILGQKYRSCETILYDFNSDGEPSFAHIDQIFVHSEVVYFFTTKWVVHKYCNLSLSYCCLLDNQKLCIRTCDIIDYKPLNAVRCLKINCQFMHIILNHQLCQDNFLYLPHEISGHIVNIYYT